MEHKPLTEEDFLIIQHAMQEANVQIKILLGLMKKYPILEKSATPEQYAELESLMNENDRLQKESFILEMAENHGN